jgi:GT2 family glycosyltransferase
MQNKLPATTLIIVNFNGRKYLKPCLDSVYCLNYPQDKTEVILVDNGSTDGSIEFVKTSYPRTKIIVNDTNNYCRANNLAISQATGQYIALINNDVKLDQNWLHEALKEMQSDERIGALSGKILLPDGKINSTGHLELPGFYWVDRGFKEEDRGQYDTPEELLSLSHCCCLYRKECLKETGPLDEDFNMYLEDVDMSLRLRQKGWKIFYCPTAVSYHWFHGTVNNGRLRFYIERNRLFLIIKYFPNKLKKALFNKGYFSLVGKLNKDFWLDVLTEIQKKNANQKDETDVLKVEVEKFYQSKIYRFLVHPVWKLID